MSEREYKTEIKREGGVVGSERLKLRRRRKERKDEGEKWERRREGIGKRRSAMTERQMKETVGQDSSRDSMRRAEVNIKIDKKKNKKKTQRLASVKTE